MDKTKVLNLKQLIKSSRLSLSNIAPDLLVICVCLVSLVFSIIESRVNIDAHHWGFMYANATQLNQGLIPFKDIFIQYGFLTTWIQAFAMHFLGDTVVAVGIITGVFYSINIYLSYCLWQKVLNRWLSAVSALLMFLVHGYIIYPWSNYISYTFLLLALLLIVNSQERKSYYILSGVFFALNVLARQTSLVPTLIPIELYFVYSYLISKNEHQLSKKKLINIAIFNLSIATIFIVFYLYLVRVAALKDWYLQSVTILDFYEELLGNRFQLLKSLVKNLIRGLLGVTNFYETRFKYPRLMIYSFMFLNCIIICARLASKIFRIKPPKNTNISQSLFLLSSISLVGYLQSVHIYEIFRLQSASSLGIGLTIFSLDRVLKIFGKWKNLFLVVPIVFLTILLCKDVIFVQNASVYFPWDQKQLISGELREPQKLRFLQGKLYDFDTITYYETLKDEIEKYSDQLDYLVNYTPNSYVLFLSDKFRNIQKSPFYNARLSSLIFSEEENKISELFEQKKAILVTSYPERVPINYCYVHSLVKPIPYISLPLYVTIPKNIAKDCKSIP
ncbi:glycosyltransferase family 39 protein [Pseudanabaena sp. FACHB-1998]|uniref:glycosyltransferase family 39 protein n=1 Tax=Pseudanabaena sp. FACHB-1998 TaxID=2692858 RepID=UPI001681AC19|nr:glycosyltransferase family 39 protein [Pseudanabaena sp. FACHB-1998]MBD2176630.1 glycosyltransferase family 39 protein [Pseudanabaena sp. FACHB-1998]